MTSERWFVVKADPEQLVFIHGCVDVFDEDGAAADCLALLDSAVEVEPGQDVIEPKWGPYNKQGVRRRVDTPRPCWVATESTEQ